MWTSHPNLSSGQVKSDAGRDTIAFAEAVSCQLEFKYLAKLTGRKEFYQRVSGFATDISFHHIELYLF
jgi:mannosyl-oligosaccharide alpha-1,2-mannosidase